MRKWRRKGEVIRVFPVYVHPCLYSLDGRVDGVTGGLTFLPALALKSCSGVGKEHLPEILNGIYLGFQTLQRARTRHVSPFLELK